MRLNGILLFTVFSLLIAQSSHVSAADNSITESLPFYTLGERLYLLVNYGLLAPLDDIEWNKGQNPSALIFDPNGVCEPIRQRNLLFNHDKAYLDTTTGNIYVDNLFTEFQDDPDNPCDPCDSVSEDRCPAIMHFNGTELLDP